jgi:hypothetical protein
MFPAGYATSARMICLALPRRRACHLLRYPAFALHASVLEAISADQHWQVALAGEGHSAEEWCRKNELP